MIDFIQTYTGKHFHFLNPHPDEICIDDIVHSLSQKCRFNGHCHPFYSVAEHCIRVSHLVPQELKLSALLHDAAEAYMPDVARPIKVAFKLEKAEAKIFKVIAEKYQLVKSPEIKQADDILLATEARDLMNGAVWDELPPPLPKKIKPLSSKQAEIIFMEVIKIIIKNMVRQPLTKMKRTV